MLDALRSAVESHTGEFACSEIHNKRNTTVVRFGHAGAPPIDVAGVPDVPGLRDFYATFGSLLLYQDTASSDAAYHIADPSQWADLDQCFRAWFDHIDQDELDEFMPDWSDDCLVVGEVPQSGNYLLVAASGPEAGKVFIFDHDGYEFEEMGSNLADFVMRTLDPDSRHLTNMAAHLSFITDDTSTAAWWIEEMRDSRGNVVKTES